MQHDTYIKWFSYSNLDHYCYLNSHSNLALLLCKNGNSKLQLLYITSYNLFIILKTNFADQQLSIHDLLMIYIL